MSRGMARAGRVIGLVGLALSIGCVPRPRLPIFLLARPAVTAASVTALGTSLFHAGGILTEFPDRFTLQDGDMRLDVYKSSGGIWMEDSTRLWNPSLTPFVPDTATLSPTITDYVKNGRLAFGPDRADSAIAGFEFTGFGSTWVETLEVGAPATTRVLLDRQINIGARVRTGTSPPSARLPVTGGGGEFKATLGDSGRLIGYSGVWREIRRVIRRARVVPRSEADRRFLQMMRGLTVRSFRSRLAYYSAPAPLRQDTLRPVYIYSGIVVINGHPTQTPEVMLAATEGTPAPVPSPATTARTAASAPPAHSEDPEGPEEGGTGPTPTPGVPWLEVGASWLGATGGLSDSEPDVNGFLEALRADNWAVNFNWGDYDAWYEDWRNDRAHWVDAADLVFYTGHADMNGWMLRDHANATTQVPFMGREVTPQEMASAAQGGNGVYGGQDLEWIAISACGPLQDEELSPGGGDAIGRWAPAFGGLHVLLGYGSVKFSSASEGQIFAGYLLEGKTVINDWLRTAEEVQPSTNQAAAPNGPDIWAGAMWAYKTGRGSPYYDHLWGHGTTGKDSPQPDTYKILWSGT